MARGSYEGVVPGQSDRRSGRGGREEFGPRGEIPSDGTGRSCLKEELKRLRVRFHRKNMLGDGKKGICCSLNGVFRSSASCESAPCSFREAQTQVFGHWSFVKNK